MKILICTGSRSEWGVLEPLVKRIDDDPDLTLQVLATASHLSPEFGMTVDQIGYQHERVETLLSSDTAIGTCKSMGLGLISTAEKLSALRPDLVVIEGDRYEMLAVAIVAYNLRIPIAHISGGDVTAGSLDDAYRDCITRMATLHFPDTVMATYRVDEILGNEFSEVYPVGSLSLDFMLPMNRPKNRKGVMLILHPSKDINYERTMRIIYMLKNRVADSDVIITRPGADAGNYDIRDWILEQHDETTDYASRITFLMNLAKCSFVIGNSSAGIVEAPYLGTPTINIGQRQHGRPMASSIIQAEPTEESIKAAIEKLHSKEFQESLKNIKLGYMGGNVSEKIVQHIKEWGNGNRANTSLGS